IRFDNAAVTIAAQASEKAQIMQASVYLRSGARQPDVDLTSSARARGSSRVPECTRLMCPKVAGDSRDSLGNMYMRK
ncbi:hypothetical protein, partial [Enterococcus faecalis]|uniref:hypothetical protein n=1 Tax=Enterococcus faecalis TaxID=1351 RepID=UPI00403F580C